MARLSGLILKGGIDKTMLDLVRPVNSLYLTVGSEDPNTVFGGTWVKLTGGVLACAGTAGYAAAGAVGGSKKISVGQMPSHIHSGTRTRAILSARRASLGLKARPSTSAEASPITTCRTPYASRCGGALRDLCGAMPL